MPPSSSPATVSQALRDKVRELFTEHGWSQRTLAKRLGVTPAAVRHMLARKRRVPALDLYERLAAIFGLSLSVLCAELEQRVDVRPRPRLGATLTPRQEAVLRLTVLGHNNVQIAAQLRIQVKTVETHKTKAMHRLQLTDRVALVRYAARAGWYKALRGATSQTLPGSSLAEGGGQRFTESANHPELSRD